MRSFRAPFAVAVASLLLLIGCTSRPPAVDDVSSSGGTVASTAAGEPVGDPKAFSFKRVDPRTGAPVRFNPCQPIHYVINPEGGPEGAVEMVQEVVRLVSEATGIEFVYDGIRAETFEKVELTEKGLDVKRNWFQPEVYGRDKWAPLLISWGPLGRKSLLQRGHGGAGGSLPVDAPGVGPVLVSGGVVMDIDGSPRSERKHLMHEMGHVMGLDHVEDTSQIMAQGPGTGISRFGAGDLAGLRQLGRDSGCLPEIAPTAVGATTLQ